jgi:hypothetical protein
MVLRLAARLAPASARAPSASPSATEAAALALAVADRLRRGGLGRPLGSRSGGALLLRTWLRTLRGWCATATAPAPAAAGGTFGLRLRLCRRFRTLCLLLGAFLLLR